MLVVCIRAESRGLSHVIFTTLRWRRCVNCGNKLYKNKRGAEVIYRTVATRASRDFHSDLLA
jgi:hypothetical protein